MKKSKDTSSQQRTGVATKGKIKTADKKILFNSKTTTFKPARAPGGLKLMPEDLEKAAKEQEAMVTASGRPRPARKVS